MDHFPISIDETDKKVDSIEKMMFNDDLCLQEVAALALRQSKKDFTTIENELRSLVDKA